MPRRKKDRDRYREEYLLQQVPHQSFQRSSGSDSLIGSAGNLINRFRGFYDYLLSPNTYDVKMAEKKDVISS